jgi:hypothetical protein
MLPRLFAVRIIYRQALGSSQDVVAVDGSHEKILRYKM